MAEVNGVRKVDEKLDRQMKERCILSHKLIRASNCLKEALKILKEITSEKDYVEVVGREMTTKGILKLGEAKALLTNCDRVFGPMVSKFSWVDDEYSTCSTGYREDVEQWIEDNRWGVVENIMNHVHRPRVDWDMDN